MVRDDHTGTSFTFVCCHSDGQRSFIHTLGTNGTLCNQDIDRSLVERAKFCFVTGAMVMPTFDGEQTAAFLAAAQEAGVVTLLDTVYDDSAPPSKWCEVIEPCLPHVDYFIPSLLEAKAISGLDDPDEMARLFQDRGCRHAIIKLDQDGALVRTADGSTERMPAYQVDNIVDTTGAGDCWAAGFLTGLRAGESVSHAALLGNAVAAHTIQAPGAAAGVVSLDRVREFQKSTPLRE